MKMRQGYSAIIVPLCVLFFQVFLGGCGDGGQAVRPGTVWNGDFLADTQATVDSLWGYAMIDGDLVVSSRSVDDPVVSLDPLTSLVRISGDVTMVGNDALVDLTGLGALTRIGGDLILVFNENLADMALPALVRIGGCLRVEDNAVLCASRAVALREQLRGREGIGGYVDFSACMVCVEDRIDDHDTDFLSVFTVREFETLGIRVGHDPSIDYHLTLSGHALQPVGDHPWADEGTDFFYITPPLGQSLLTLTPADRVIDQIIEDGDVASADMSIDVFSPGGDYPCAPRSSKESWALIFGDTLEGGRVFQLRFYGSATAD
ncbi:receptor L domain-containing protein [Desulfatiferula olefinivorans]